MNLLEMIKDAGVIGAGGAGFPTHVKLASKAEFLLMNAAECEPLLRVDQQLMEVFADEILLGFEAAGRLVEAKEAIIGIKEKHKDVIRHLNERIQALNLGNYIRVQALKDVYPAGDEQVLVYELTGRVVPEAGIPIQVGCVVVNSETALNIYNATKGLPVTEKYVTITGDVPEKLTVKVPVGTPIIDVLKLSGIEDFQGYSVIDGGPMMGPIMKDLSGFVTKKTKGLVILKKQHDLIRRKSMTVDQSRRINRATCEQCRMCTDLCPRYLLGHDLQPHKMMRVVGYGIDPDKTQEMAMLCCQCNLCELFACPVGLYPRAANMFVRQQLVDKGIRYECKPGELQPREVRKFRLLPSKRLVARLGLYPYDKPAPMSEKTVVPDQVSIALVQHVGAPAKPIVTVGQRVEAGQMIGAIPEGSLGAAIHASIAGTVTEIGSAAITIRRD